MKNIKYKTKYFVLVILVTLGFNLFASPALAASEIALLDNRVENVNGKTVKIIWQTDIATKGKVIFGETALSMTNYIVDNDAYKKYHEIELSNLKAKTTYYYRINMYSGNEQSNSYVRSFKTDDYNDGLAPQLTNVEVPYVSGTAAFVRWDTQEDASSVVQYSVDESYKLTAQNTSRTKKHQIILKNLKVNTTYHLRIYSVDKDGNKSSYHYRTITTSSSDATDKETFKVQNFRPATVSDSFVGVETMTVSFKTNHYARGKISISRSGFRTQTQEVDYNTYHQVTFSGLSGNTEYKISYNMVDIFGKGISGDYTATTKAKDTSTVNPGTTNNGSSTTGNTSTGSSSISPASTGSTQYCSQNTVNGVGYYGRYYNLPDNLTGLKDSKYTLQGQATGWYADNYLTFDRVDTNLAYRDVQFLPITEKVLGLDPFYFSVYWRAILEVPEDMNYQYEIKVDNSGWVYIDGKLVTDMGGLKPFQTSSNSVRLTKGYHYLEIYYAERGPGQADFYYSASPKVIPHPWPMNCALMPNGASGGSGSNFTGGGTATTGGNDNNIVVAGEEFALYTKASALLKTYASPDIYAIMNGQRHFISSPASFNEYGFDWMKVRTVSQAELEKYPRARLIKSGTGNTIYYLFQKPEGQWLKINLGSPTVFASYPANYWGNVISVTELDVDSYPDVKLIKTKGSSDIYYLENNERHLISNETFVKRGYNKYEICEVNQTHLESYKISSAI